MHNPLRSCPPLTEQTEQYLAAGWWRTESFVDDLYRAAAEAPDKVALIGWRHRQGCLTQITFGDLAIQVDRLASGLAGMGITTGSAVAFQLPNWWETSALTLACARIGAIAVPVPMWFGARDLERILAATGAAACVVTELFNGIDYGSSLAEMAPRLPAMRHPLVIGDFPASLIPAIERHSGCGPTALPECVDPNAPAVVFFTSGTSGISKGVIHSQNTLYAAARGLRGLGGRGIGPTDVLTCLAPLSSALGALCGTVWPLVEHGATVFSDVWEPSHRLRLMSDQGVTCVIGFPAMIAELAAQRPDRRNLAPNPAPLRLVVSTGAPLTRSVIHTVTQELGGRLVNLWGMTETQGGTSTVDSVTPAAARCIGRTLPAVEIRKHGTDTDETEQLSVRGPSVCLSVFNRDTGVVVWEPSSDDGWFNTGDLVTHARNGGLTFISRTSDRVMGDIVPLMIPALEIEEEIKLHPDIVDAALVSYTDDSGIDHPCAVIVVAPSASPPNLTNLRSFLTGRGISLAYLPSRLGIAGELPRDAVGKIRKRVLRDQLAAGSPQVST